MLGDEVLAQLTEMFGDYMDQRRIQRAVDKYTTLEVCIEALLTEQEEPELYKPDYLWIRDWKPVPTVPTQEPKATGAIKKVIPADNETTSFASFVQKGNQKFGSGTPQPQRPVKGSNRQTNQFPQKFASVVDTVNKGFRVMVLMRGAPGSGKSYLARALIDKTLGNKDYRNHIFSTDNFFIVNGVYKYQVDRLEEAHRFNHNNVRAKARDGWSPIVVDNTNIKLWEMHAYVQIAAEHGYILEVLEPVTHWRYNARGLAARNTHGVPEHKIRLILGNYEKLKDTAELYRQCQLEHARHLPPKMRHFPIVQTDLLTQTDANRNRGQQQEQPTSGKQQDTNMDDWVSTNWEDGSASMQEPSGDSNQHTEIAIPKPPRQTPKHMYAATAASAGHDNDSGDLLAIQSIHGEDTQWIWPTEAENSWKLDDEENIDPDGKEHAAAANEPTPVGTPKMKRVPPAPDQASFLLSNVSIPFEWRTPESSTGVTPQKQSERKKYVKKRRALVRHRRGCRNENTSFSEICNLYPQIPAQLLWDLFEKCNGDGNWTASLLLEEQKSYEFDDDQGKTGDDAIADDDQFECDCNEPLVAQVPASTMNATVGGGGYETDRSSTVSSNSPRNTIRRKDKILTEDLQQTKKQLESFIVLGREHYSEKIQQIRAAKGIIPKEEATPLLTEPEPPIVEDTKSDPEVLEVTLGVDLIKQLHAVFQTKYACKSLDVDELTSEQTKVFMATEVAEQLYNSFLDSVYSRKEEKKLSEFRRDAQIARELEAKHKYPALFNERLDSSDAPNLNDIIEMEHALSAYRNEINGWVKEVPQDLAAQMTRQKLKEMFPSVEQGVLEEILHAHDNKFHDTVNVLNNSIPEQLRNQIAHERVALLQQSTATETPKPSPACPVIVEQDQTGRITGEDAINLHMRTAEECRNLAQHHQELKNECHEKARSAIQRGMAGVAEYYAQIAGLHRTKIDMFNSKASNAIMEVHRLTLNNADVLDLHYLHSEEALRCLEIFLAEQASRLRSRQQQYKELFIITGRGLHSADGIPIIKHRVKAMLRDLSLRCVEINPGFLKIKLQNNSDMLERLIQPQS
ncbi:NEDD4-binding protein 2 [Sabethes cyaneus]|uniref:NEDD4-binding protein 2 n=1 Tax=Sabethes cyaneus TaxID=53552 RepID=UPI00237EDF43|nr:NEDD4-binding protein 2 [Sabethes cyaneus]